MVKVGEVAFIKTTGEAVFVLDFVDPSPKIGDKELYASVRRPTAGQDGIKHHVESFEVRELETLEEQRKRFMSEREDVLKKFTPQPEDTQNFLA